MVTLSLAAFFLYSLTTQALATQPKTYSDTHTSNEENSTTAFTVVEYHPAPGQFVNVLPTYEEGDTHAAMCRRCEEQLQDGNPVTLGALGGYITFRFSEPIKNLRGSDILIKGNAYYAANDPKYGTETIGGSIEPGTVWAGVGASPETAKWYELAGSEYFTTERHATTIVYNKPLAETGDHSAPYSTFDNYIAFTHSWASKDGTPRDTTGFFMKNTFHQQSYWPSWKDDETLTFSTSRLPDNAVNYGGTGEEALSPQYWLTYRYAADSYGYADAAPNSDERGCSFDLDWAVDAEGNSVHLEQADFIRVQSAVLQQCGWTGETSTEVSAIENLHLRQGYDADPIVITPRPHPTAITAPCTAEEAASTFYYIDGTRLNTPRRGINIVRLGDGSVRKVVTK